MHDWDYKKQKSNGMQRTLKQIQGKGTNFVGFSDIELYMLKRQCIIASTDIMLGDEYNKEEQDAHCRLMDEINEEINDRKTE